MERYFTEIVCSLEDPWIYFFKPYKLGILEFTSHQTKTWIGNRIRRFREGGKIRKWETALIERLSCAGYSCHSTCSTCSRLHKADKHEPISPSIWVSHVRVVRTIPSCWSYQHYHSHWEYLNTVQGVRTLLAADMYRQWDTWMFRRGRTAERCENCPQEDTKVQTRIGNGIQWCWEEAGQLREAAM